MEKHMAGPNPVYTEGDLVISVCLEDTTAEGTRAFFAIAEPVFRKYGRAFLLTDATRNFTVSPEARRLIAEWSKTHHVVSAVFGHRTMARAMLGLITRASSLFSQSSQNVAFFASESEARAWLEEQRHAYLRSHPDAPR